MSTGADRSSDARRPGDRGADRGEDFESDLHPNQPAGRNAGPRAGSIDVGLPTARDVKEVHRALGGDFADDELKLIPVLPTGRRLEQGATYVDLCDPAREEFTARAGMAAGGGHWYIPKDQVPYSLWNRLTGVRDPERIPERRPEDLER
jgi:hypothetical protein